MTRKECAAKLGTALATSQAVGRDHRVAGENNAEDNTIGIVRYVSGGC